MSDQTAGAMAVRIRLRKLLDTVLLHNATIGPLDNTSSATATTPSLIHPR